MDIQQKPLYPIASQAGLDPHTLVGPTGGLIITIHGARILGVFLDGARDNLVWTHPELADAERATAFVKRGEWNLGGDRCWLAPELELHFKNPEQPSHEDYAVPSVIDPGRYTIRHASDIGIVLQGGGEVTNLKSGAPFNFETLRSICLCDPPADATGVSYVGYELQSELRITTPDRDGACYGLWQLVQIPPGGRTYIPVMRKPEIVDYFRTGVDKHIKQHDDYVVFPVTGKAQHKLGVRADDGTGWMAYYRPVGDGRATLMVRQTSIFGGATYADYPAHDPSRRDVALQFYNDSGAIGGFGEMEYHSVAAIADRFFYTRDVSRMWCFGGSADRIQAIGRELLGVSMGS